MRGVIITGEGNQPRSEEGWERAVWKPRGRPGTLLPTGNRHVDICVNPGLRRI